MRMQRYNYFFKLYIFEAKNLFIFILKYLLLDLNYCIVVFCEALCEILDFRV